MGNPRVTFRPPQSLEDRLKRYAVAEHRTLSNAIEYLLDRALQPIEAQMNARIEQGEGK